MLAEFVVAIDLSDDFHLIFGAEVEVRDEVLGLVNFDDLPVLELLYNFDQIGHQIVVLLLHTM